MNTIGSESRRTLADCPILAQRTRRRFDWTQFVGTVLCVLVLAFIWCCILAGILL